MSETNGPAERDPDTQPIPVVVDGERKRAAIALLALAVVAVAVVVVLVKVLGGSGSSPVATPSDTIPSGPATTVISHSSSASSSSSSPPTSASSTSRPRGPVSCPTSAPCVQNYDVGDVLGALNDYRRDNGVPPVSGRITAAASRCALSQAATGTCPDGFVWEPIGRNGKQMITKVVDRGNGGDLLSTSLRQVGIGWAYLPSSKSFSCVLVLAG